MSLLRSCRPGIIRTAAAPPAPSLVSATNLATGTFSSIQSSVVSDAVSPAANALLICTLAARADGQGDVTFLTPTTSLSLASGWQLIVAQQFNSGTSRWAGVGILLAVCGASPGGPQTITFPVDGSFWNISWAINQVTQGFVTNLASYPRVTNVGTGTTLAVNLASAPASSSLGFSALAHEASAAAGITPPSGMTGLNDVPQSSNVELEDAQVLTNPNQNNTWTNLDNTEAKAGAYVEILQAA